MAGPPPARPSNLSFLLLSRSPPSSPPHFLLSKPPPIHLQLQPATMASPPSATVCTAARHSRRPLPWTANVPPACGMTALARTGAPLARAHGRPLARAHGRRSAAVDGQRLRGQPPLLRRASTCIPLTATVLRDAPSRRFVRFERDPVGAREFGTQNLCPVAATSCMFFRRSDRWIVDFFAPSQSRFAGPTLSACISSTAAPFGILPVPVRSWTLWLQLDPLYLSAQDRRRIVWRCLLA
ncbi:putative formin-2-like [Iris pallida]|uniref:Formin-2-like n=1 Tax=Iris pallida TaxID=29817 RepID=A0AAX6F4E9_IRIPA|nr:putative formin-2-like [Iris pallida]